MRFAVIGGDIRQATLSNLIRADGHDVKAFGIDAPTETCAAHACDSLQETLKDADCVVLPIPIVRDAGMINAPALLRPLPISEFMEALSPNQLVVGGRWPDEMACAYERKDVFVIDVLDREDFAVQNAVPTAEGALQIALENTPFTLHGAPCLVIGYGRIGKILAGYLKALGAHVTVSARKSEDLAWIAAHCLNALHSGRMDGHLERYRIVFNTVPSLILTERRLRELPRDTLIIDLASSPGGVDFDAAHRIGVRCIWALGLPGKTAPQTAGYILRNTVYSIMKESGYSG